MQKLLPLFTPEDIEAVLNVKMAFDGIPDADMIFGKVLALPGHVLQNIFQLNLSQKELKALKTAAQKFISNEDTLSLLGKSMWFRHQIVYSLKYQKLKKF